MIRNPLIVLAERVSERWRDRVLTALTLLIALDLFVVVPLGATHAIVVLPFSVSIVLLLVVGLLVVSQSMVPVVGVLAALALLSVALALRTRGGNETLDSCLEASGWLLIGLVLIRVVARAVFGPGEITYHRVIGAILLYLTIGVVFVALYTLVGALSPGSFTGLSVHDRVSLPPDLVYFSFTTLTTVGYGDVVPVHPFARSLSNLEAIIGQLYPATLLARMVSLEVGSRR
jgi:Ion channel